MSELPPPDTFAALARAIDAVTPSVIFGLTRLRGDSLVETLYRSPLGLGGFLSPVDQVPAPFRPGAAGVDQADVTSPGGGAMEWHLDFAGARRVISVRIP